MKLFREGEIEPATINRCLDNPKVIMKEKPLAPQESVKRIVSAR
jgi:hypothetical protein